MEKSLFSLKDEALQKNEENAKVAFSYLKRTVVVKRLLYLEEIVKNEIVNNFKTKL